ncbi:MAG: hypothetical protein MUC96_03140 [Myxococcaceae bacterium]|nr:hypothetical protein [Myxococcaceae bacterium]
MRAAHVAAEARRSETMERVFSNTVVLDGHARRGPPVRATHASAQARRSEMMERVFSNTVVLDEQPGAGWLA